MDDSQFAAALCARFHAGERLKFLFFWDHEPAGRIGANCFSQWYEAPFTIDGTYYPTAEHYMMAEKAALFGDADIRAKVLATAHPGAVKALGRKVGGFDEALWRGERFAIVVRANGAKFSQNPPLLQYLRDTGSRILVEASPIDPVWGIGLAQDDPRASDPSQWRGLNLLGFALMRVREEFKG